MLTPYKEEDFISKSNDYEIKMSGEKQTFEGGAVRYSKEGKGRFDLIPGMFMYVLLEEIEETKTFTCRERDILKLAYSERLARTIITMIIRKYGKTTDQERTLDDVYDICPRRFYKGFLETIKELAIHYQKGAEIYGPNNWQKGIPYESFLDSGRRHLNQWLLGENDENHYISAIWNFAGAIWTLGQNLEDCKRVLTPEDIS